MKPKQVEMEGHVSLSTVDYGSKSERAVLTLKTADGATYVLRKDGAPAFGDHSLDPLIGGNFTVEGVAVGDLLLVQSWTHAEG
ncbi:Mtc1 family protein [Jiella pacifica]|uniref:Uncharacterized protein n=1 Tax=Jiella pacifica TaxID=2696469 RepID=A0A6N9SV71_9HYPH|nr:Mtc1 family protein [Jiella pacifica]NDW02933.1 hypothetical protein [Jiella pacifica]